MGEAVLRTTQMTKRRVQQSAHRLAPTRKRGDQPSVFGAGLIPNLPEYELGCYKVLLAIPDVSQWLGQTGLRVRTLDNGDAHRESGIHDRPGTKQRQPQRLPHRLAAKIHGGSEQLLRDLVSPLGGGNGDDLFRNDERGFTARFGQRPDRLGQNCRRGADNGYQRSTSQCRTFSGAFAHRLTHRFNCFGFGGFHAVVWMVNFGIRTFAFVISPWVMVKDFDGPGHRRIVEKFAGAAMQRVGEAQVKPHRTWASERDIAARWHKFFHARFVCWQIGQFSCAGGGVEGGEVEGHRVAFLSFRKPPTKTGKSTKSSCQSKCPP